MKMYTEIKKNFHWFSLIELLVSISILATISIVGYVSYSGHMKIVNNTTRIQTIDSLYLSLSDYHQMKKTLPEPNSNYISYDERGTYMHSLSGSYGVSGYVSNNFLPAGYLNFYAIDPESKQFYGYGKLTDNTAFDVAAALYDDTTGGYKTYLRGTYSKSRLSSLIRSYSSSNFVSQDSTENLPYNPYERKITAHISSYSGTVSLSGTTTTPLSLTGELNSGDTLIVGTGGSALLHISDGSELSLGSTQSQTELSLDSLRYNDENNLSSKVALILKSWEIWAEAPHYRTEMDSESDLSIQTDTAVAAVRGTVFGVSRSSAWVTAFSLASGKLEVAKLSATGSQIPFAQNFSTTATGGFIIDNAKSYMVVPDGGQPIKLDNITSDRTTTESTSVFSESEKKIHHPKFSLGYRPKADKISFTRVSDTNSGTLSVTFQNYGADSYYISFGTGEIDNDKKFPTIDPNPSYTGTLASTGTITITGSFVYLSWERLKRTYVLRVCSHGYCSAPDIKVLGGSEFAFDNFKVWGEKKKIKNEEFSRCTSAMKIFCDEPNLVAYAPYDVVGDLNLYQSGTTFLSPSWSGGNLSFSWVTGGSGVFFDSILNSTYLKYTLPINFLTESFSIEMSVRGGALKRTGGTYILVNGTGWSESSFKLQLRYWDLFVANWSNTTNQLTINSGSISSKITDNNSFYKVRYDKIDNTNFKLSILKNNLEVLSQTRISSQVPVISSDNNIWIWVWSRNTGLNFQWNDIIDSVKIYNN